MAASPGGFPKRLVDLYTSPAEAFAALVPQARFWTPLAILMALNLGVAAVWLERVDPKAFIESQWEEWGVSDRIALEKRGAILEASTAAFYRDAWLSLLGVPLLAAGVAGVYLFIFRFFLASEIVYKQSLAIVAWSLAAVGLVQKPLGLLTLALRGDWNLHPEMALESSLASFVDRASAGRALWALAGSFDLFVFWTLLLLITGYRVGGRHGFGAAALGVALPWTLFVLVKVGFLALF